MKKYKGIIIFGAIMLIYSLVMFSLFYSKEDNNKPIDKIDNENKTPLKNDNYYLVTDNSNFKYYNMSFNKASISSIEQQNKFNVYVNNKKLGDYKLKYAAVWNLFDEDNNFQMYDGKLLAVTDNMNAKVRDIKIREINDSDKVLLINKYNLNTFSYISTNEVVDIDLDNNGVMDEIICLSSMQESDNSNNHYSIVLVKLNNEIVPIIEERGSDAIYVYNIYSVINIFDREYDNIIISRTEGYDSDEPFVSDLIYQCKNNQYVID